MRDHAASVLREMGSIEADAARLFVRANWPKRKPIRRVGARASREKAAIVAFRETVLYRCGDYCERCDCRVGREKIEAHHLVRRARCVGWFLRHDPAMNGAGVCWACHRTLDLDPMDVGGPLEGESRRAHATFQEWRAENGKAS